MESLSKCIGACLLGLTLATPAFAINADYKVIVANQPPPAAGKPFTEKLASITDETETAAPKEQTEQEKINQLKAEKEAEEALKRAYTLKYSGKGKGPDLANTKVKGQLFQNSRPISNFEAKTNEEGQFVFNRDYGKNVSIDLYHISGQEKMKLRCHGLARPGSKEVKVTCTKM